MCMAPEVQRSEEPHEIVEHFASLFGVNRTPISILEENAGVFN